MCARPSASWTNQSTTSSSARCDCDARAAASHRALSSADRSPPSANSIRMHTADAQLNVAWYRTTCAWPRRESARASTSTFCASGCPAAPNFVRFSANCRPVARWRTSLAEAATLELAHRLEVGMQFGVGGGKIDVAVVRVAGPTSHDAGWRKPAAPQNAQCRSRDA